jgi:hypothetical protein
MHPNLFCPLWTRFKSKATQMRLDLVTVVSRQRPFVVIEITRKMPHARGRWFSKEHNWKWRTESYGILRRVALIRTDVSEELSASFIRVTRIGELGTTLAVTSNRRMLPWLRIKRTITFCSNANRLQDGSGTSIMAATANGSLRKTMQMFEGVAHETPAFWLRGGGRQFASAPNSSRHQPTSGHVAPVAKQPRRIREFRISGSQCKDSSWWTSQRVGEFELQSSQWRHGHV